MYKQYPHWNKQYLAPALQEKNMFFQYVDSQLVCASLEKRQERL